jgi:hypothetical protein
MSEANSLLKTQNSPFCPCFCWATKMNTVSSKQIRNVIPHERPQSGLVRSEFTALFLKVGPSEHSILF